MRHGRMARFPLAWKASENEPSVSLAQAFIISAWEEKEREKVSMAMKEPHSLAGTARQPVSMQPF